MKVERIKTVSTEFAIEVKDLAKLLSLEPEKAEKLKLGDWVPDAVKWIEANFGVVMHAGEFRFTAELPELGVATSSRTLRIPIGPVISGTVKVDGKPSTAKLRRGYVMGLSGKATCVDVEFMAGFHGGMIPHPVKIAIAIVCRRWSEHPEERRAGSLGDGIHKVAQYLELFGGGRPMGGVPWQ